MDRVHLAVARALGRRGLSRGDLVSIAVSGGADSVALMHICAALGQRSRVAHVHHGLRGEDADRDAEAVARSAQRLGLAFEVVRLGSRGAEAPHAPKLSPEAWARRRRYEVLDELRRRAGAVVTLTAHTLDDQAETLLLRAIRGTDLEGLAGIVPFDAERALLRPLVEVQRQQLRDYLAVRGVSWREDATNQDRGIPRNRIRLAVLPELERAHPGAVRQLARLAQTAHDWRDVNRSRRRKRLEEVRRRTEAGCWIHLGRLQAHASPERRAMLAEMLRELGLRDRLERRQLAELEALCTRARGTTRAALPDGVELVIDRDRAWLGRGGLPGARLVLERRELAPELPLELELPGLRLVLTRSALAAGPREFQLPLPRLQAQCVMVRSPSPADRWPGSVQARSTRPLIERMRKAGWPQRMRRHALVVECAGEPIGVLALDVAGLPGEEGGWRSLVAPLERSRAPEAARWELRASRLSGIRLS